MIVGASDSACARIVPRPRWMMLKYVKLFRIGVAGG